MLKSPKRFPLFLCAYDFRSWEMLFKPYIRTLREDYIYAKDTNAARNDWEAKKDYSRWCMSWIASVE